MNRFRFSGRRGTRCCLRTRRNKRLGIVEIGRSGGMTNDTAALPCLVIAEFFYAYFANAERHQRYCWAHAARALHQRAILRPHSIATKRRMSAPARGSPAPTDNAETSAPRTHCPPTITRSRCPQTGQSPRTTISSTCHGHTKQFRNVDRDKRPGNTRRICVCCHETAQNVQQFESNVKNCSEGTTCPDDALRGATSKATGAGRKLRRASTAVEGRHIACQKIKKVYCCCVVLPRPPFASEESVR